MTATVWDYIAVGAGHNGLSAACPAADVSPFAWRKGSERGRGSAGRIN
jgi:hypothetical protein